MQKLLPALAILGWLSAAPTVQAQDAPGYAQESPKELFEGASRMVMQALELLIKTVPQYEAPVVLENGDILIRRKRTEPEAPQPGPDQDRI